MSTKIRGEQLDLTDLSGDLVAGSTNEIQFNDGSGFGASSALSFTTNGTTSHLRITDSLPGLIIERDSAPAEEGKWRIHAGSGYLDFQGLSDSEAGASSFMRAHRSAGSQAISHLQFVDPLRNENQTAGSPAFSFTNATNAGLFYSSSGNNPGPAISKSGNIQAVFTDVGLRIRSQTTVPSADDSGYGILYLDNADDHLKFRDDGGNVTDLTAPSEETVWLASPVTLGTVFADDTWVTLTDVTNLENNNATAAIITYAARADVAPTTGVYADVVMYSAPQEWTGSSGLPGQSITAGHYVDKDIQYGANPANAQIQSRAIVPLNGNSRFSVLFDQVSPDATVSYRNVYLVGYIK